MLVPDRPNIRVSTDVTKHGVFLFFFGFLTFTVSRVVVELETGIAQAHEGAVRVDTLTLTAHVIFAAFVHI